LDETQQNSETEPSPTPAPEALPSPTPAPDETPPAPPTDAPKAKRPLLPFILLAIFLLTILPGPLFFASLYWGNDLKEPKTVIVPRGSSVQEIAQILSQNGVIHHSILMRGTAHLMASDKLQAGEYRFTPGQNVMDVTIMMRDGKMVIHQFTAAEGLSSSEIVVLLRAAPELTGDIAEIPEEGSLLPETYRYLYGDTRMSVIKLMRKNQAETLQSLWDKRETSLPFKSPREAVILASIVEKETGQKAEERPMVAGVFLNRLKLNMPLQTDPTVIYALTNGKAPLGRALVSADLETASAYNTYQHPGLPPGPICNPGRAALEAALHPQHNDFLYFVANGTGGHAFAKTLEEHNKNVGYWHSLKKP